MMMMMMMIKSKRTGESGYYKITKELSIKINAKRKILIHNPICYRLSDSREGHSFSEEIQIQLRIELFGETVNCRCLL
jgi:hypothetical protein